MPTRTTSLKFMDIDGHRIVEEILSKGISRTEIAVKLNPQYEFREDAYHKFRNWMRRGRMPVDKYNELRRILDGTV